jgi:hypothetical protein
VEAYRIDILPILWYIVLSSSEDWKIMKIYTNEIYGTTSFSFQIPGVKSVLSIYKFALLVEEAETLIGDASEAEIPDELFLERLRGSRTIYLKGDSGERAAVIDWLIASNVPCEEGHTPLAINLEI